MVAIFTGIGAGFERGSGSVLGGAGLLGSAAQGTGGDGVFLNAATGNLLISKQDEYLVGRGPDVSVTRTYNSLGDFSDDNGDNWRQSTDRRIVGLSGTLNTAGSSVSRVAGDGTVTLYSWDASRGAYVNRDGGGAYDTLSYASGNWTWTDGDTQARESYGSDGSGNWRITAAIDTDGNSLTFGYTGANLTQVTTADGSWVQYSWSGSDITQITAGYTDLATGTAATLTRTRYGYDSAHRLTSVTVDLSPGDGSVSDGKVYTTAYTYDGTSKRVATITQTDGSKLAIAYDASGRVTSLTQTVTTGSSGTTRVTSIAYGAGYTNVTDATGQVTKLDYNIDGSLKQVTMPPAASGSAQQVIKYSYTATGDIASITDAAGKTTSFGYNTSGNVIKQTDPLGNITTRTYGAKNELLTETTTGSDEGSASAAHTTRYVYDDEDHPVYAIDPSGAVTEYRYTSAGQLQYVIGYPEQRYDVSGLDANTAPSQSDLTSWRNGIDDRSSIELDRYDYDARGNLRWNIKYGTAKTDGSATSTGGYSETYFTYDQAGQLLSSYRQDQASETFVYDGMGRLIASTDAAGATTSIVFSDASNKTVVTLASGLVTTSTYDKAGDLLSVAQAGSYVVSGTTTYAYDALGRARITTDPTGHKSYTIYDDAGRKVGDVDQYGDLTEYRYDADNRLNASISYATAISADSLSSLANPNADIAIASIRPGASADDQWSWRVYDADGRVTETIDGTGNVVVSSYDGAGQLVKTTDYHNRLSSSQLTTLRTTSPTAAVLPSADAANDEVTRQFYDVDGRLIGTLDGEGYLSRLDYDFAGQLIESYAFATPTSASNRASGSFDTLSGGLANAATDRVTHYVYDGRGLLRFTVDTLNQVTNYQYDRTDQLIHTAAYAGVISATSDYSYDNIAALINSASPWSNAATRDTWSIYDTAGRLAYAIDGEGAVTGFSYDASGNVIKTVHFATKRPTTSAPTDATMDTWAASAGVSDNSNNRVTRNYYDARGELRYTVDGEGYVSRVDYDAAGRVIAKVRWSGAITVDDTTTIAQVAALPSGSYVTAKTTYDADGRISTVADELGVLTAYAYSANGTLASTTRASGTSSQSVTTYAYDGAGRTITKTDGYGTDEAAVTHFAYDGLGNLVSATDANGNVTKYAYDQLGQLLTETDALGGVTSYQYDAFGGQVLITDARGGETFNYYDALGRVVASCDAEGYVTKTTYDSFGDIASVARGTVAVVYEPSTDELPVYFDEDKDEVTTFSYDRLGRLTKTIDAMGAYESYTLDAFGQRVAVRNKLGATTTYTYDARGLQLSETLPISSVDGTGTTEASTVTNSFQYDARGNLTKRIEAAGLAEQRTTSYVYDAADRLTATTGDTVPTTSGSVTPTQRYYYDVRGNLIQSVDANGAKTNFYYDNLDRLTSKLDALGHLTTTSYDDNGNAVSTRIYNDSVSLPTSPGGAYPDDPGAYRETLYTYDKLNRLLTTSITGVRTGVWSSSSSKYIINNAATITTTLAYDATGNVIKSTDANGGVTYSYYDKLGRKTGQVDQDGYCTEWFLDQNGNVVQERRYATAATGTISTTALPSVSGSVDDRKTVFDYDAMGRRLSETRYNVAANSINTSNGALIALASTTNATITYTYNALGQVTAKREATGDQSTYAYDSAGRMTSETRATYSDQTGASVTPTLRYSYDGLGDLTRTQQGGATANSATDHITTNTYGAGGRLTSTTDAAGDVHNYAYDAAGNVVRDSYVRTHSDGSKITEAKIYTYDLLGRMDTQSNARLSGSSWVTTDENGRSYDKVWIDYDAFGQVVSRGLTAASMGSAAYNEFFSYDLAGRMTTSNAGDGVWRYYFYDAAGNQTLALAATGDSANLRATSYDSIAATISTSGTSSRADTTTSITIYDKRGQATETRSPGRELSASSTATLTTATTYNAFGEITTSTDARGSKTSYSYNTLGKLIQTTGPSVSWTAENGAVATGQATQSNYYDLAGRLIGVRDANGNLNTMTLRAGSGYDGEEASALKEFHADGGVFERKYDVFGDKRTEINEVGKTEAYVYDKLDRLVEQDHQVRPANSTGNATSSAVQLVDHYSYDELGERLTHWNSQLGSSVVERTDYDVQGRVTSMVDLGGDTTTYSYVWSDSISNPALNADGSWTKTTTNAAGLKATEKDDYYGNIVAKTDFGGHSFTYTYDAGGHQVKMTDSLGGETDTSYYNSGLVATVTDGTASGSTFTSRAVSTYNYDADGNRTFEGYVVSGVSKQHATVTWDAANRMTGFTDTGDGGSDTATIKYEYDLAGNVRHLAATYHTLDQQGAITSATSTEDYWYRYDSMNRFVTTKGTLTGKDSSGAAVAGEAARGVGTIGHGATGQDITYDAAGERTSTTHQATLQAQVEVYVQNPGSPGTPRQTIPVDGGDDGSGHYETQTRTYTGTETEHYAYTTDGYLATVSIADEGYVENDRINTAPTVTPSGQMGSAVLRGSYVRDAMGRETTYSEYQSDGSHIAYSRADTFNTRSEVTQETTTSVIGSDTYVATTTNSYNDSNGKYQGGIVTSSTTVTNKNGVKQSTATTTNGYQWWDAARQNTIKIATDYVTGTDTTYNTTYYYDAVGHLSSVYIADGRPRTVAFVTSADGTILQRDENDGTSTTGDPREVYYYFDGMRVGDVSNNGTSDTDYAQSITAHQTAQGTGPFRGGSSYGGSYADFDQSYDPINGLDSDTTSSRYTVRDGDTLATIAQSLWGDSSLWYMLADANGMDGTETLVAGRDLIVPNKVANLHNTSSTYRVYDPNEAIGNNSPTATAPNPVTPHPTAQHKHNCGVFGAILVAVVAVAVVAILHVPAANLLSSLGVSGGTVSATTGAIAAGSTIAAGSAAAIGGGVLAGVAGSIASQAFGVATGIQDKFSWKGVALAGLSAGVGGALGAAPLGSGALGAATRGVIGSVLTQGLGVVTGLQSNFDWAGVAAAGVGAAAGAGVGSRLGDASAALGRLATSAASDLADAATRSVFNGTDFGDNILAALPDVVAQTVGGFVENSLANHVVSAQPTQSTPFADADLGIGTSNPLAELGDISLPDLSSGAGTEIPDNAALATGMATYSADAAETTGSDILVTARRDDVFVGGAYDGQSARGVEHATYVEPGYQTLANGATVFGRYEQAAGGPAVFHDFGSPEDYAELRMKEAAEAFLTAGEQLGDQLLDGIDSLARNVSSDLSQVWAEMSSPDSSINQELGLINQNLQPTRVAARVISIGDRGESIDSIQSGVDYALNHPVAAFGEVSPAFVGASFGLAADGVSAAEEAAVVTPKPYSNPANRPSYGSGQVDEVWANAQQNGRVFDPNTGDLLTWDRGVSRAGQWDMGHLPGQEYRVLHERYMSGELTTQEFLQEYRNPQNYRPELPSANRSHRYEGR